MQLTKWIAFVIPFLGRIPLASSNIEGSSDGQWDLLDAAMVQDQLTNIKIWQSDAQDVWNYRTWQPSSFSRDAAAKLITDDSNLIKNARFALGSYIKFFLKDKMNLADHYRRVEFVLPDKSRTKAMAEDTGIAISYVREPGWIPNTKDMDKTDPQAKDVLYDDIFDKVGKGYQSGEYVYWSPDYYQGVRYIQKAVVTFAIYSGKKLLEYQEYAGMIEQLKKGRGGRKLLEDTDIDKAMELEMFLQTLGPFLPDQPTTDKPQQNITST